MTVHPLRSRLKLTLIKISPRSIGSRGRKRARHTLAQPLYRSDCDRPRKLTENSRFPFADVGDNYFPTLTADDLFVFPLLYTGASANLSLTILFHY